MKRDVTQAMVELRRSLWDARLWARQWREADPDNQETVRIVGILNVLTVDVGDLTDERLRKNGNTGAVVGDAITESGGQDQRGAKDDGAREDRVREASGDGQAAPSAQENSQEGV